MILTLHNTLSRKKEEFTPLDAQNVRMYVCGPTVYGRAHLGNARSLVVYDVLYRLLRHVYGTAHVTYARNITDVDDKINAAAKEKGVSIGELTTEMTQWFHDDMAALGVLPATKDSDKTNGIMIEPKATDHIPQMVKITERLISNDKAYVAGNHVLFSVRSMPDYGKLSGRIQDELEAGARVKVESYKRDAGDFVLWKPAAPGDDASSVFDSPWGPGRPGWHIECSAMSTEYLGQDFDIHGGGSDLMFPHHENEIAQSEGAYPGSHFARYWVHNGFLTVGGEKMSKSLGNFITVKDLLDKGVKGEVIRLALLSTKYNEPLNWTDKLLADAQKTMDKLYRRPPFTAGSLGEIDSEFLLALLDDLNTPKAIACLQALTLDPAALGRTALLLGLLQETQENWFKGVTLATDDIESDIAARNRAKKAKNWAEADRIRNQLKEQGVILEDRPDGTTNWRKA